MNFNWKKLFDEWKNSNTIFENDFYKDGIVNETVWNNSTIKILYILKEVHETEEPSVCDFLKSDDILKGYEQKSDMWRKVAYLSYGILNSSELDLEIMKNKEIYCDTINSISILNLKKCAGGGTESSEKSKSKGTYTKHARDYAEFIKRQIFGINPNVIICCNTFEACKRYIFNPDHKCENNGYTFKQEVNDDRFSINVLKNDCIVFNNYHPTAWNWLAKKSSFYDPIVKYCKERFN